MEPAMKTCITTIRKTDFTEWSRLFHAYIDFYKSSIPEAQYQATFDRLIEPKRDLYGLALRSVADENKLFGIAHYYPHQTPWAEKQIMHLNDLYIDPSLRGKGHGREMINAVADAAKEAGCFRLAWSTKHDNPARKLYDEIAACDFVEYRRKLD